MDSFAFVLILVVAVIASQPIGRFLRVAPLPIVQIAIGAALAWPVTGGVHVELEPELFLLVFLPPLLFSDAWQAPKREFWQLRLPIAAMAFGLVFFTIAFFGLALNWLLPEVPLAVAFAAAAVLSPTDAVAVSSIVNRDSFPPRLLHLLEGEALLNDASGLVIFRFATAAALTGAFSFADAAGAFLWAVLGGALCGFLVLWASVRVMKLLIRLPVGAAETQVLLVIVMPFLAYLLAEYMGASGVLAAVVMGLLIGRAGLFQQLGVTARMLSSSTWNIISFALNGAIFVFLGMQLPVIIRNVPSQLMAGHWLFGPIVIILVLTLCLMALRFIFLVLADAIGKQLDRWQGVTNPKVSLRIKLCGAVAGVRGAVTLAGVLSLPLVMNDGSPFPARDLVIFLAAGVILCWLFIATAVLPGLARGLDVSSRQKTSLELRRARIGAAQAAIAQLQASSQTNGANERVTPGQAMAAALISDYQRRIDLLEDGGSVLKEAVDMQKARADLQRAAIEAEIAAVRAMLTRGEINDVALHKLLAELNASEAAVVSGR